MRPPPRENVRNIGIISHIDAGKTTVSERILYYSGEIHRMGEVHDGLAVMDWMPQERERGITITATATSFQWQNFWINLIDTPGHIDFTIEVERSMRVLDGAIAIFSAVDGVQPQSESVWRQAERYRVPRLCFINKMDRIGADVTKTMTEIAKKLHARPVLIQLPFGTEDKFSGVIDLLSKELVVFSEADQGLTRQQLPVPEAQKNEVLTARKAIVEAAADFDDTILADYLADRQVSKERLIAALRKGTIACGLQPVLLGSALRNKGLQPLLDAVTWFLPSPLDGAPVAATLPGNKDREEISCNPQKPCCALAFKVLAEEGKKLTYLRIYAGTMQPGMALFNSSRNCLERVGRLFLMHAHKREPVHEAVAGDIIAVTGLKEVLTGDTLCDPAHKVILAGVTTPEPVVSLAVEAKGVEDREKLLPALEKLQWEDPTFLVKEDRETGQTILTGMGELHLEILIDRLAREYAVKVKTGPPQVVLRETIKQAVERRELFQLELEGKPQHGEVLLKLTPLPRGEGVKVALPPSEESSLPPDFRRILGESLIQACAAGCKTGYPLTDLEIRILEAPFIPGITTLPGLKAAAQRGTLLASADVLVLLEPIMSLEITIPSEYAGKVLGSLQQKGSQIQGITARDGEENIIAHIPLSAMFGYMTELRSATRGRGTYTMEFSHFDVASVETQRRFGLNHPSRSV
jgi:elongation factor G